MEPECVVEIPDVVETNVYKARPSAAIESQLNFSDNRNETEARVVIGDYRCEYDQQRPHSRFGYLSPARFAAQISPSPAPVGLRPPSAGDGQNQNNKPT